MKNRSWRDVADLIGVVSIVAGLILVAYELRQNSQLMRAQVFNDRSNQGIEVFLTISENPELSEIDALLADGGFPEDRTAYEQLSSIQKRQYLWLLRADRFRMENILYQQHIGVMEFDAGHIAGAYRLLERYDAIEPDVSTLTGRKSTERLRRLVADVEEMYGNSE